MQTYAKQLISYKILICQAGLDFKKTPISKIQLQYYLFILLAYQTKNKMKKIITSLLMCIGINAAQAQYFTPEIQSDNIGTAKEVYAVTLAGDTVRGKMGGYVFMNGQMRSFSIKQADKTKTKFSPADVTVLAVKPNKLANLQSAMAVPNIARAGEMDLSKVLNREWVFFEQALLPKAKDKYVMMQLLNPGFDSKIKVYLDPNAKETKGMSVGGIKVGGGEDKSYLVVYDGSKSELYKKSRYKKEALTELYKDCDVFTENYAGEKFQWKDFTEHVLVYDQLCK
ncbi:MAG: hypothetical protein ACJA08_001768 [Cyclobacteriaceae bacterium]